MNKNKKGILLALCLVLAVPVCGSGLPAQATSMSSITSDSIREKQDQINQAQKERETMKSNLSNLEQIKKDLETKKSEKLRCTAGSESERDRTEYCRPKEPDHSQRGRDHTDTGGTGCGAGQRGCAEGCHDPSYPCHV